MIYTYLIYNFIFVSTTLSAYLYEKSTKVNNRYLFLLFSFLIPFIFLALRYDVGQDYHNYVEYFERIANGAIILKEPGYIFINYFISSNGLDVQWLFVVFGFFTMFFLYKSLPKDGFALFVVLYLLIFYFYSFTAIRQAFVMALMLYASKYIHTREFFKYLLYALVGSLFHFMTAIMLFLAYFFANRHINRFLLIAIILVTFGIVVGTDIAHKTVESIVGLFPKYSWYLNSKYMEPAKSSTGYLGPMIKIFIGLVVIFFKDKIITNFPKANIAINLYAISLIGSLLRLDISIFGRMEAAYMLFFILSIVYFVKTFEKKSRVLILFLVTIFYYLMFIHYMGMATKDQDSGLYLIPYRTILNKHTGDTNVYMP